MKQSTSYHDYKDLYAAALERLCEEHPEAELDDLKREAEIRAHEQLNKEADMAANNNEDREDHSK